MLDGSAKDNPEAELAADTLARALETFPDEEEADTSSREWKDRGGVHFKARRFGEARDCYTEALDAEMASGYAGGKAFASVLYANRSACLLELRDPEGALLDAGRAVQMDKTNRKAFFRKGKAFIAMERHEDALDALLHARRLADEGGDVRDPGLELLINGCESKACKNGSL
mmetsp:Transcript_28614/g.59492  ORF Transcript_28614/g.59492 Transcript_28614/m.59492 type:complete len:172 (+) Transcript_28614:30-545(+)